MRGEYTNENYNDIECLSSENIIADGEKSTYNLRNRGEKNTETDSDECKELWKEMVRQLKSMNDKWGSDVSKK